MQSLRILTSSMAALALACATAAAPAVAAPAAAARGGSLWSERTVLRQSGTSLTPFQVIAGRQAGYALAAVTAFGSTYQLLRTSLVTHKIRRGPMFPLSAVTVASGSVWVYGMVFSGAHPRLAAPVLHQVNPATLAVARSWTLAPASRRGVNADVTVTAGPGHSIWVGFLRTLLRIDTRTGTTIGQVRLGQGLTSAEVSVDPARRHLYVVASRPSDQDAVFEYSASSGRVLASVTHDSLIGGVTVVALTAVPGGAWASFRQGSLGSTLLLREHGLGRFFPPASLFRWPMNATTMYGGGALWLDTASHVIGCVAPRTGRVRSHARLPQLGGLLFGVDAFAHVVYALGNHGVIAITPPHRCWA